MGIVTVKVPSWRASRDGGAGPSPRRGTSPAAQTATATDIAIAAASGLNIVTFSVVDLAASLAASKLYRAVAGATVVGRQIPIRPAFRGYIGGLSLSGDAAKSAGVCTFEVFRAGAALGAQLVWTTGLDAEHATFAPSVYGFTPGQALDVRVSTDSAFSPITVDVLVDVWLIATSEASTT